MLVRAGGDLRPLKQSILSANPYFLGRYLIRAPFGGQGWIIGINNLEDLISTYSFLAFLLFLGAIWYILTSPIPTVVRSFTWSSEAYLSYSLSTISIVRFLAATYSWYNNTAYPSELFGPTGPEASQAQTFTFLIRDQKIC